MLLRKPSIWSTSLNAGSAKRRKPATNSSMGTSLTEPVYSCFTALSIAPMLFEKHAIAIGIEAVSLLDRVPIGGQHKPSPTKGAHQHELCGLWRVEVGEERPHNPEFVCWINEKTGFGSTCDHSP